VKKSSVTGDESGSCECEQCRRHCALVSSVTECMDAILQHELA